MKKVQKSGPARMRELGNKSIQFFLSEAQTAAFKKLAQEMGVPVATLARRAANYFVGGGVEFTRSNLGGRYARRYD